MMLTGWNAVFDLNGSICLGCDGRLPHDGYRLHIDHIVPLKKGGTNDHDNLCILHECCNQTKERTLGLGWFAERVRKHRKTLPLLQFKDNAYHLIYPNGNRKIYLKPTAAHWAEPDTEQDKP